MKKIKLLVYLNYRCRKLNNYKQIFELFDVQITQHWYNKNILKNIFLILYIFISLNINNENNYFIIVKNNIN